MTIENENAQENVQTPPENPVGENVTPENTGAEGGDQTTQEWEPDFSPLNVMDKEFEWDEDIKKVVNQENYERLKELQNKAYGLPFIKDRLTAAKDETKRYKDLENTYLEQTQGIEYLNGLLNKNDYGTFFRTLKIPDEAVMRYALDRANYQELPPDKQREYDLNMESRQRLGLMEQQNQQLNYQMQQQSAQVRGQQLDIYLSKPDISSIATAFDTRAGRTGAFRDAIIERGQLAAIHKKVDLTPEQAAQEVMSLYGDPVAQTTPPTPNPIPSPIPGATTKPVLPNVKANAQSPAKKVYKSTDELRKLAETMED